MSRTIKFRAWDKRFKNMVYASPMAVLNLDDLDHEITQFTGLLDRNGKEIYEGDKLKVEIPGYIHGDIEAEVEFNDGCFGIRVVGNPILNNAVGQFKAFNKETKGIEVIGNIYENWECLWQTSSFENVVKVGGECEHCHGITVNSKGALIQQTKLPPDCCKAEQTKSENVLIDWERDFTKFYTFRFEYLDFDGKKRYELASVNDPMTKAAALTMVNKHIAEFNGRLTDFVECDYFKSVVGQLLLDQHRKSREAAIDDCIQAVKYARTDNNTGLMIREDQAIINLQALKSQDHG